MRNILFLFLAFALFSCESGDKDANKGTNADSTTVATNPVNLILLIGDGMGVSQMSASFYFAENTNLVRFNNIGFINTSSASHKVTDSGAGGSAFAIGEKTYNGAIGVGMDSLSRTNIVEYLSKMNYKAGVVATSQITHATPAVFYSHVKSRKMYDEIAVQLVHSEVDFFAAGGTDYFLRREDGINYMDSLKAFGFEIDTMSLDKNFDAQKKYGFLMAPNAMPAMTENRGDFLPKATSKAIEYLSAGDSPFFLMVEGSQIDWAGHDNNKDYLVAEMLDFDKVIGVAMDFAEKDGNTLVIVLADHETGGFTLSASHAEGMKGDYNVIDPSFATSGHSAALIPVLAFGPGSELFRGFYQNNEIYAKMIKTVENK